ncbi:S1 RNA-binding domain-containing protein [Stackebrandtia soli]|uniref:S1 RNA-binding domain-containing protein n=1 Tax=Stackebrandtia soli TaxID=1892856 RepID=UPI0039E8368E
MLPYVYQITKYDPADRDELGRYVGAVEAVSDHGPVESAYLQAIAAFAEAVDVDHLVVREPQIALGFANFGAEPNVEGHGLTGLFPPDLTGFHDGARVSLAAGLELVRAMLRDNGAWCRLEVDDTFTIHVGWDQYVYIGSTGPCGEALARTRALGLFPERRDGSPYDVDYDEPGDQRPADDLFWDRLRWCVAAGEAAILEENHVYNATRWHRLDEIRTRLTPRARLVVWPDLFTDVDAVIANLPEETLIELVWEDRDGQITSIIADETQFAELVPRITDARAAALLSLYSSERHPLFTGVLPDNDGVLRARWRTEPTPSDEHWTILRTLYRGQVVTGTVIEIADFGVTFVDIGGFTAMINIPELSWGHVDHPTDVVAVGQEITAEILDVDLVRDRVSLSMKALQADPMADIVSQVGHIVTGTVTKIVPFGVFVRIDDGIDGLVHNTDPADEHVDRLKTGDALTVKILEVDITRRRITLSYVRTLAAESKERRHT